MSTRDVSVLKDIALRYDMENDSPFRYPDESVLEPVVVSVVDDCQNLMIGFESKSGSATKASGIECAERVKPDATAAEGIFPPATNRGIVKYDPDLYPDGWGGYDGGVEASIMGSWDKAVFERLSEDLSAAKQAADDGRTAESYLDLGGFVWLVRPMGASTGFWKYKWVLESHGIKLYIHSNPGKDTPAVRVRFGFECLARVNLFVAVATLRKTLEKVGFRWEREIVSRVDMQILLEVDICDFAEAMSRSRFVSRCRGSYELYASMESRRIETIMLKSKNVELCIYDKRAQLLKADSVYLDTFYRYILQSDECPEKLTRVEFRVRRGALKRYGIDTFDDLRKSQSALPQLLGTDWFRILAREKVRGSETVIPMAPIWIEVLQAFRYYFGSDSEGCTKHDLKSYKHRSALPKVERVVKQAMGLLSSAASIFLPKVTDIEDVRSYCNDLISRFSEILYFKTVDKQIYNNVVRGRGDVTDWDCRQEIDISLSPFI